MLGGGRTPSNLQQTARRRVPWVYSDSVTPKALCTTAQACRAAATLGGWRCGTQSSGRGRVSPTIPPVVGDLMQVEQRTKLVLEADAAVMRLLSSNVATHSDEARLSSRTHPRA
jgi:hypothetical protein